MTPYPQRRSMIYYYARTSYDNAYSEPLKKHIVLKRQALLSEYQMFGLLDRLHHTANGLDGLPAWFLRLAAPAFAYPLAYLINLSINSAIIPEQWETAVIRPVIKVPHPVEAVEPSDYRPISMSRINIEPCADVIVSAAARWSIILFGGGAAPGPKSSGGAGWGGEVFYFSFIFLEVFW